MSSVATPAGAASAASAASQPGRTRWFALLVVCSGMLMIVLDATIVTVALPLIQRELHFSQANLAWVTNAYLITFGGLLMLAGRLGDLLGPKRVFVSGLCLFTAASALCGIASDQYMLIAARFVQGAGGALTSGVILEMIVTMFPDPAEQPRALGVYGFVATAGGSIGLLAGGVLTQAINWHWIFYVNLPIGLATLYGAFRLLPADRGRGWRRDTDVLGAGLLVLALMIGVYTIVETSRYGWGSAHTGGFAAAAVALMIAFLARELFATNPIVPLRFFRSRNTAGANLGQTLAMAAMFGQFFIGVLYLQHVLGYDPLQTGLAFLPITLLGGALPLWLTPRLQLRFGAKPTLILGLALLAGGLTLLTRVPAGARYLSDFLPAMVLLGAGNGLAILSIMTLAMGDAGPEDTGLASGTVNTTLQLGGAIGVAILASLSTAHTHSMLVHGISNQVALLAGYHLAFSVASGAMIAALLIALSVLKEPQRVAATEDLVGSPNPPLPADTARA
ncbi:MAG: MFS transporter [Solirubrobacterales bacterium]|nr:MFS transporter [Solirubrobacterales bacterium]